MWICEHNRYGVRGPRCRKHVQTVQVCKVPFGKRASMTGPDQTVYINRAVFRCPEHQSDMAEFEVGRMSVKEYEESRSC